ncbi:MAG: NAAT family transporter [Gemmatimonadota bacterium]|nr:NAAT family transporter [Gemmatimonadota bacterium]
MRDLVLFFVSLFSVVNPLAVIPTFVGFTQGASRFDRRKISRRASIAVFLILTTSYLAGEAVLQFFSISVASLRVAGGILIFGMAWSMLQATVSRAKQTREEAMEASERDSIAVVPLAMPLLAGPGAISLMIIVAGRTDELLNHGLVLLGTAVVALITWGLMLVAGPITKALGRTGLNVATRFMGLILAAIAVEFISSGLLEIFPGWGIAGP